MKRSLITLILGCLMAASLTASAQDNSTTPPEAVQSGTIVTSEVPQAEAAPAAAVVTPAEATAEPAAPATEATSAPAEAPAPVATIPLIVMDEVPLTDAVKNLARQANINYMLDPRISFGQPGPDGRPVPQPTVSIRWENISAEQALNALLNNYNLQLVEDPKTKIARVSMKDPAAPDPLITKIIQLKYTGPSNILASAQTVLTDKRSKIMGDVRTSQLVVLATEKELDALDKMIARLDLPTRQVLIEARLLETSMNPKTIKGVDWTGTLAAQNLAFGNNLQQNTPAESVNPTLSKSLPKMLFDTSKGFNPATAFLDADGVNAVFSFINQNSEAKVISAPRTVTLDNETANISVTRQIPILTTSPSSANTPGSSSITYSNLGVVLNVTPRISAENKVNLRVLPEVSRVFSKDTILSGGFGNTVYTFDSRTLSTTVVIPSGHTLVLGGLVQDDTRSGNTKVPGLGDIPVLGRMFRSESKDRAQNNLIIFITPTIVQDSDFQPTKSTFLQTAPVEPDNSEWGAWDNAKPYDWSKKHSQKPEFQEVSSAK
ncbi:MAG: type II secretion system protein GspD [Verrucomicrobiota bacterium]